MFIFCVIKYVQKVLSFLLISICVIQKTSTNHFLATKLIIILQIFWNIIESVSIATKECYYLQLLFRKFRNLFWGIQFWHILLFLFVYQRNPKTQTQNVFHFSYKVLSLFIFYTENVFKKACAVISFILSDIIVRFWTKLEYVEAFQ